MTKSLPISNTTLTEKLLATTGMSDAELWAWWCELSDEWRFLFLSVGLGLELWEQHNDDYNKAYDYRAEFDWLDKALVWKYVEQAAGLTKLDLTYSQITDITPLQGLVNLTVLELNGNQITDITPLQNLKGLWFLYLDGNLIPPTQIEWLRQQLPETITTI